MRQSQLKNEYQLAIVLDADNIMGEGVLSMITNMLLDTMLYKGTELKPRNRISMLDTISEEMNNHFRIKELKPLV
jgi:hypothetical protein